MRLILCAASALCFVTSANAQWLELSQAPPPPSLGSNTHTATLANAMTEELDALSTANDPAKQSAANLRRLARSLLLTDPQRDHASALIVAGMELHAKRDLLDEFIGRLIREDEGIALLGQFDDNLESRFAQDESLELSRSDLVAILAPLAEALDLLAAHDGTSARSSQRKPAFTALRDRAAHAQDRQSAALVDEVADFLERGWAFADLRPRIVQWHSLLDHALDYLIALSDATWLDDDAHADGLLRARDALTAFRDPQRRDEGERRLHALNAEAQLLKSITKVYQDQEHRIDITTLRNACLHVLDRWEIAEHPERLIERLTWLNAIVDRMNDFRALGLPPPTPRMDRATARDEWRRTRAQIVRSYLAAEESLLTKIDALARDPRLAGDPANASRISNHRELLDDLHRLDRIEQLVDAITLIRPGSAGESDHQMRRLALLLVDPIRRIDAAATIERIERDLTRYWPLPFEDEVRARSELARTVAGDLDLELIEEIDRLRDEWAIELSEGVADGDASQRLALLHRLMIVMQDIAPLVRSENDVADVWWLPEALVNDPLRRLLPRLHRAAVTFLEGNDQRLMRGLDDIERGSAAVRLAGRLLLQRERTQPGAPLDLLEANDLIASFIHYANEAAHAHETGRQRRAAALRDYTNRLAQIALANERK